MGVVVGDVIDEVQDGTVGIIVENRTDHSHMLPAGMPLGNWTLCDAHVEVADKDVALCARTTMVDSPELLAELEQAHTEVLEGEVTETERNSARTHSSPTIPGCLCSKSTDLGRTNLVEHEIEVGANRPIKLPPRQGAGGFPSIKWRQ